LVVVEGKAPSVLVIPPDARRRSLTEQEIAGLVQQHGYTGALLLAAREARAMSRAEVAEITKISLRYLEAIEQDAYDRLPSATFVRGYVRELARLYRLEEESVVAGYLRRLSG
jgi:cytoskeleton protein RodZ